MRDILKVTKERQAKFGADVLAKLSHIGVPTQQSGVSNSNMKKKMVLLQEVVKNPIHKVDDNLPMKMKPHIKVCY